MKFIAISVRKRYIEYRMEEVNQNERSNSMPFVFLHQYIVIDYDATQYYRCSDAITNTE